MAMMIRCGSRPMLRTFSSVLSEKGIGSNFSCLLGGRCTQNLLSRRTSVGLSSSRSYSIWPFGRGSTPQEPPKEPELDTSVPPNLTSEPIPLAPPSIEQLLTDEAVTSCTSARQELAALELEHGFLASYTSGVIEKALCSIHDQLGLPWYLTIPIVIVTLRMVLVPINIWSMQVGANNMRVKPQMDIEIAKIRDLQARGEQQKALEKQQYLRSLMKTEGFRPFAPLGLPLVQGSLFVSFFWALREMGTHNLSSLTTEGALWFCDLTTAGPWYGLPLIASALTLLSIETAAEMGGLKSGQSQKVMWFLRAVIVGTLWLFHNLPSAVFLYWCTNNSFSLVWGVFVRLAPDWLKASLKIPDTSKINNQLNQKKEINKEIGFLDGFKAMSGQNNQKKSTTDGSFSKSNFQETNQVFGTIPPKPRVWKKVEKSSNISRKID
ncbi:60Kd inner membrane protein-domain-containing protein [Phakopsora pachyrhizi]|nr:60Kd inner membrane protein-domain-containing protein [Phakopsora pachyrhizi]KAI8460831.1 60Kd inner membrane protein-domain-containing protein [Phakopsora pachyrhizi]